MEHGSQTIVHRNIILFALPIVLLGLSMLLLLWEVLKLNLSAGTRIKWPWRLQLLDIQSAATVATISGGLVFARAQYATAVRPMIGWTGTVVEVGGLSDKLAWSVRLINGATSPASFHSLEYCLILRVEPGMQPLAANIPWITREDAIKLLDATGLRYRVDYDIRHFGPAFPLSNSSQNVGVLAVFTRKAMAVVDDLLIRMQATDQAGDTSQRVISCMRGVVREPTGPMIE